MNPQSALVAEHAADIATPGSPGPVSDAAAQADGWTPPSVVDSGHVPTGALVPPTPVDTERLEARRTIGRAKLQLMTVRGMSEPEAYRWIQKSAMDRRLSMLTVASRIIDGTETAEPELDLTVVDRSTEAVETDSAVGNHLGQ